MRAVVGGASVGSRSSRDRSAAAGVNRAGLLSLTPPLHFQAVATHSFIVRNRARARTWCGARARSRHARTHANFWSITLVASCAGAALPFNVL